KAMEVANTIADKPPWAVKLMRDSIKQGLELPLQDALELERNIFKECYTRSDRTEATAAFLEKREHKPYNDRRDFI
ncbi:MAG: crotonase, partial [Firmicutes bacterium]|nr:crotonase [Bacillota bacterium]